MIGVKMSEKETVDFLRTDSRLRQSNHDPAATVEQKPPLTRFDKNG
jgi:hypothetical protein